MKDRVNRDRRDQSYARSVIAQATQRYNAERHAIFYVSQRKMPDRTNVTELTLPGGGSLYLRIEEVAAATKPDALDLANPHADETVMNTLHVGDVR